MCYSSPHTIFLLDRTSRNWFHRPMRYLHQDLSHAKGLTPAFISMNSNKYLIAWPESRHFLDSSCATTCFGLAQAEWRFGYRGGSGNAMVEGKVQSYIPGPVLLGRSGARDSASWGYTGAQGFDAGESDGGYRGDFGRNLLPKSRDLLGDELRLHDKLFLVSCLGCPRVFGFSEFSSSNRESPQSPGPVTNWHLNVPHTHVQFACQGWS